MHYLILPLNICSFLEQSINMQRDIFGHVYFGIVWTKIRLHDYKLEYVHTLKSCIRRYQSCIFRLEFVLYFRLGKVHAIY